MLDIVCVAHIPGPVGVPVQFGHHRFSAAPDKQLTHYIDGTLVATVPPEGMADYAKAWPQCQELVDQLTRSTPARELEDDGAGDPPL